MKRFLAVFYCCLLIFCKFGLLGALELELTGGLNEMSLESSEMPLIIGNLNLRGDISTAWAFGLNIERDNIMQNTIDFRLKTRKEVFAFEFGILGGINNDFDNIDVGILGSMEITWPKVLFLSVGGSSTIGSQFDFMGENFRESACAKLGFWLPFAILTFSADTKSYCNAGILDNLLRYQLSIDFFNKTSSVNFRIDAGQQTLTKGVYGSEPDMELTAFFAGLNLQFNVSKHLRFIMGGEMPFSLEETPYDLMTMFKAYGGFRISFF